MSLEIMEAIREHLDETYAEVAAFGEYVEIGGWGGYATKYDDGMIICGPAKYIIDDEGVKIDINDPQAFQKIDAILDRAGMKRKKKV